MEYNLQEIQENLKTVTFQRKQAEEHLELLQKEFSTIQIQIETNLESLQLLKDQESSLQNKFYLAQKESIKEALSVQNIKKIFSDSNPFVKKIKEKGKEIKEALDGTALDKKWLDEQYENYKESCIKKGNEIKSKEEFKSVALSLKDVKEDATSQLSEIWNKAGSKIKKVGEFFQEALVEAEKQESIQEEKTESQPIEIKKINIKLPETKKEGLELWVKQNHIKYSEDTVNSLYPEYVAYLNKLFDGETPQNVVYSSKAGAFKQSLKKFIGL